MSWHVYTLHEELPCIEKPRRSDHAEEVAHVRQEVESDFSEIRRLQIQFPSELLGVDKVKRAVFSRGPFLVVVLVTVLSKLQLVAARSEQF